MNASINIVVNHPDHAAKILAFAATLAGGAPTTATGKTNKTTKKAPAQAAAAEDEDETLLDGGDDGEEGADEELSFDEGADEDAAAEEVETKPAKAKKVTEKDVHAACLAHAKKNNRASTLAILKKFKATSVAELDAKDYAKVVAALTGKK